MWSLKNFVLARLKLPYRAEFRTILFERESPLTNNKRRFLDAFERIMFVTYIIRITCVYLDQQTKGKLGWENFDILYRINKKIAINNFPLYILLFAVFGFYLKYFFNTLRATCSPTELQCHRQLCFHNPEAMIQDNKHLFQPYTKISAKNVLNLSRLIWKLFRKDEAVLKTICFRKRLSVFPMLSKRNRVNEILIYLCCELMMLWLMLIHPFFGVIVLGSFMSAVISLPSTWYDWMIIVNTVYSIYLGCYLVVKSGLLLMCMCTIVTSAITFYYGQWNRFLRDFVSKTRTKRMRKKIIDYQLFFFYQEHQRMSQLIRVISDHAQYMLFVAIVTNIPLNVNCFNIVFLSGRDFDVSHALFLNIFLWQWFVCIVAVYPTAFNSTMAHRAGKYMAPLQPKITNLRFKLKWNHYHEIVHHSRFTIAYQASLFGRLTIFLFFKFVFFYFEAVIFVHSNIRVKF